MPASGLFSAPSQVIYAVQGVGGLVADFMDSCEFSDFAGYSCIGALGVDDGSFERESGTRPSWPVKVSGSKCCDKGGYDGEKAHDSNDLWVPGLGTAIARFGYKLR